MTPPLDPEHLMKGLDMSKHRLVRTLPNGTRWSHPSSGMVLFSPHGELFRTDGTTIAFVEGGVEIGAFWESGEE